MHEMGIAMQVKEIAIASIPEDMENVQVETVNLKVGKLAAVVPDSLTFCFDIIKKDSPLADAELKIEEIPVRARCRNCALDWTISEPVFLCPDCGGGELDIVSGRELEITSLELAD